MYNQYIKPVFKEIVGRDFDYKSIDDVNIMHSIVFLCQIKGAPIGHYLFKQAVNGPKSGELADDLAYMCDKDKVEYKPYAFEFSKQTKEIIRKVKAIVDAYNDLGLHNLETGWIECVATLVYWKEIVYTAEVSQSLLQIMRRAFMYTTIICNEKAYVVLDRLLTEEW